MPQTGAVRSWSRSSMTASRAASELLRRTKATKDLIAFTEYTFPRYQTAAHHRIIAEQLERVDRGEIDRLMLLVPPRHGKSELASRRFPGFYLGRHPEKQLASASASADLASDFGRDVRNLIQSTEYVALFHTRLAEDSQAKNKWHTDKGGVYYSLGVGGQFMGRGADVLLIDDPFSNMAEAQSEVTRKAVWDWYTGTAYNRLQPNGAIVVINHRMHEDDLTGHLLAQQAAGGDQWHVVELPAINEDGEALWPEAYPIEALERIKANTFSRFWSGLYLQNPVPDEGSYFRADWLRTYTTLPPRAEMQVYGGSDYAVTADGGDYTVHAVVGLDSENRMYLLDLWRKQASSDVWVETFCDLVKEWKPLAWAEESGQIKASVGPFLLRRMQERSAYVYREQFPTRGDKAVRAQSIRGRMAIEGLYLPTHASWLADFRSELLAFPSGKHDDIVDSISLVGQLLDRMIAGQPPAPEEKPAVNSNRMTLAQLVKNTDRIRANGDGRI